MRNGKRLLAVVLICAVSAAQDKAKPDTPEHAADKALADFEAKDSGAMLTSNRNGGRSSGPRW